MPLFSRRVLQRMINEISQTIGRKQLKALVHRLNLPSSQAIEGQYELAVVLGLGHFGAISYEPNIGGSSRPDVLFRSINRTEGEFVADVTCVSQTSLTSRAPVDFLIREFKRLLEPYGIGIEGFHFQVGFKKEGTYGDQKLRLKIPGRRDVTRILDAEVSAIAGAIRREQKEVFKTKINRDGLVD